MIQDIYVIVPSVKKQYVILVDVKGNLMNSEIDYVFVIYALRQDVFNYLFFGPSLTNSWYLECDLYFSKLLLN